MGGKMGVMKTIREFATNYREMDSSKYVVEQNGDDIEITHMKFDDDYGKWLIDESISIPFACARIMFSEMTWAIENNEITYNED